jgi:hypothetical protein
MGLRARQRAGQDVAGLTHHSDRGVQGRFNWASQQLVIREVFDGSSSAAADRAVLPKLRSPGHPKYQSHGEAAFWDQIARGLLPEEAAGVIGVAQAVGARWFHNAGGMPPFNLKIQPSGRHLSFAEREGDRAPLCD